MRYAFDADVLIYAGIVGHPLGARVERLLSEEGHDFVGSVLLLPEVLTKPISNVWHEQTGTLRLLLSRLELFDVTKEIAASAAELGAKYQLKAGDAVHLATAVWAQAAVLLTDNSKDFRRDEINEIQILLPEHLPVA